MKKAIIIFFYVSLILFSKTGNSATYYAGPCPCFWTSIPYPFWTGTGGTGTRLPGQPAAGDIFIIPTGCIVTINNTINVTFSITIQVYGTLSIHCLLNKYLFLHLPPFPVSVLGCNWVFRPLP